MIRLSPGLRRGLLCGYLLLGFGLRAYRLGAAGIWGDEAFSIALAEKPLATALAVGADLHPPLYHALLHFWLIAAGHTEFAARFLSLIAGLLLIPAVYVAGRRLAGQAAGLIAAGLAAVSPFAIDYSQEARMYALAALSCTVSVYFAIRLWDGSAGRERPDLPAVRSLAAGYLIATLAAMYSHFYAFFVIAVEDVYALWVWRRRPAWLAAWIAGQIGLALLFLPWFVPQIAFLAGRAQARIGALGAEGLAGVLNDTLRAFSLGRTSPEALPWGVWILASASALGLVALARHGTAIRHAIYPVLYLAVPVLLAWLTLPLLNYYNPRFLLVALPAFLILVAAGLVMLGEMRAWPLAGAMAVAILAVDGIALDHAYFDPALAKSGYREMMQAIGAQARPGDVLFLLNPEQDALFDYYGDKSLPVVWFPAPDGWNSSKTQSRLAEIAQASGRIWLVQFGDARAWDPGGDLLRWLNEHAFRASRMALVDTEVDLYVIGQVQPSTATTADFGGLIELQGYGLSGTALSPGDTLQIALAWRAEAGMGRDYTVFTHLIDDQGRVIAQFDGPPLGGAHPTSAWKPGESNVDRFGIVIDPATQPGIYQLEVGWYDLATLQRLPVLDATGKKVDDRVLLGQVEVR